MAAAISRRQLGLQLAAAAIAPTKALPASAQPEGARWLPWPTNLRTPSLALPEVDGAPWSLAQQQGQPVLLNFWASWCPPCLAELPSLGLLAQRFSDAGLRVVAVNYKEAVATVRRVRDAQTQTQTPSLLWLRDSYGEAARAWGVHSFPSSVLIGRNGQALLTVQGELDWADASVQKRLTSSW
jgi:thiol-disulfide isomerase/thioredoxin